MDIGFILLNVGYLLNLVALGFREILWIRILLTLGYFLRFITQSYIEQNMDSSFWMIVFVIINLYQIVRIVNERRKRYIEPKIFDIYESVFKSLSTFEFLTFWKMGLIKNVENGVTIIEKDEKLNSILLLINGKVNVKSEGKSIAFLPRGSFIGEISYITKEGASANVIADGDATYIEWTNKELMKIKNSKKIFWTKIQNILLNDLIIKLKRSSIN
ncbi:popeye domain-containing protein [Candidatus Marinimicrobia bacterium]|nr:popeye domain-containing protein [Candidatus Neomarinimicrobiota bacterium]|tara:strand:+ start:89 stop:736 length:648 start_codon:yes stop_codon:yes gene_type:complete